MESHSVASQSRNSVEYGGLTSGQARGTGRPEAGRNPEEFNVTLLERAVTKTEKAKEGCGENNRGNCHRRIGRWREKGDGPTLETRGGGKTEINRANKRESRCGSQLRKATSFART